jgi:hypothetical protein
MHEVIDLGAVADGRVRDRAAVDGGIAPISTSSPITRPPSEWMRVQLCGPSRCGRRAEALARGFHMGLLGRDEGKPVAARTAPGWAMNRAPICTRAAIRTPA